MENFDWVKARNSCSTSRMFEQLLLEVQEDIKKRNDMRVQGRDHCYEWSLVESNGSFRVIRDGGDSFDKKAIGFYLEDGKIIVKNGQKPMFSAVVTLNDEGECKFKLGEEEKESWQIRKKALEEIFHFYN